MNHLFILLIFLTLTIPLAGYSQSTAADVSGKHYLSKKELAQLRVYRAKIQNELDLIDKKLNVLKDMENRKTKPEEIEALVANIRESIDNIFNEVMEALQERKLFGEESSSFIGKIDALRRSLYALTEHI